MNTDDNFGNVLIGAEVEFFVSSMEPSKIDDIGTTKWIDWHKRLQKLNQQAVLEASQLREEHVKELLVSYNKIGILVHEAILISIWRTKILPRLLKIESEPENSFFIYAVLYHEATAVSLLELVLYHADSCEILNDIALDLIDYTYDAINKLLVLQKTLPDHGIGEKVDLDQVCREHLPLQRDTLLYDIGMRCISIMFHIIANMERLPLCVISRIVMILDVPLLLIQVIESKPWETKNSKNEIFHYIGTYRGFKKLYLSEDSEEMLTLLYSTDGKWQKVSGEHLLKLTGQEAHIWLTLRQILLEPKSSSLYELTQYRKSQLMRLQKYLTDPVLDQVPPLMDLKYWLCQISCSDHPTKNRPIILEMVPEIKQKILDDISNRLKVITKEHAQRFFKIDRQKLEEIANSLNDAFNTDFLEKMEKVELGNMCAGCGKKGIKRCSKCKKEWYCGRECQVKHWPQHKEKCLPE